MTFENSASASGSTAPAGGLTGSSSAEGVTLTGSPSEKVELITEAVSSSSPAGAAGP